MGSSFVVHAVVVGSATETINRKPNIFFFEFYCITPKTVFLRVLKPKGKYFHLVFMSEVKLDLTPEQCLEKLFLSAVLLEVVIAERVCHLSYEIYLGPGLQSFLKIKVTLTLREVILRHDN